MCLSSAVARASDPQVSEASGPGGEPRTERVLDDGVWVTRTFEERNPSVMSRVEAGGETHTFLYNEAFTTVVAKTVEVAGVTLVVARKPGWVTASGLPDITVRADDAGRAREIAVPGGTLASFRFDPDARGVEVTLRGGLRLHSELIGDSLRQTLTAPRGQILATSASSRGAYRGNVAKFNLDMLAPELGLTDDWGRGRSRVLSRTGQSESIVGTKGEPLIRILCGIEIGKAFVEVVTNAAISPMAYRVTLSGMGGGIPGFPWRALVMPDQGISLEAPVGPRGSVIALWSRGDSFGFRIDQRPSASPGGGATPGVAPCRSWVCSSSGSGVDCDWRPYWCDGGDAWGGSEREGGEGR